MLRLREYRAAGGVVLDDTGSVLLIERWVMRNGQLGFEIRLPKGHVEEGETDEQAAVRETCEETGYCAVAVIADLGEYLNEFVLPEERVLRHEHFYLMRLTDATPGEPHFDSANADEARFRPRWAANLAEAEALITFASEREFVARARKLEVCSYSESDKDLGFESTGVEVSASRSHWVASATG